MKNELLSSLSAAELYGTWRRRTRRANAFGVIAAIGCVVGLTLPDSYQSLFRALAGIGFVLFTLIFAFYLYPVGRELTRRDWKNGFPPQP